MPRLDAQVCIVAALAALFVGRPAHAQDEDAQLWTSTTASVELEDGISLSGQFVARFSDRAEGVSELQYQADLEAETSQGVRLGAGYSYVPRYDRGDLTTREHRIRQQARVDLGNLLGGKLATRLRLEQRWRDDGDDMALRLRARLQWTLPVGPDELAVRLWHESFVNLNDTDWTGPARYSRARQQLSVTRRLAPSLTGEIGYLNQYDLVSGGSDQTIHALSLTVSFEF